MTQGACRRAPDKVSTQRQCLRASRLAGVRQSLDLSQRIHGLVIQEPGKDTLTYVDFSLDQKEALDEFVGTAKFLQGRFKLSQEK